MIGMDFARHSTMISRLLTSTIAPCLLSLCLPGQAQDVVFPPLKGETVKGEEVVLPNVQGAKWTLVGIAYSTKASPVLEEWYEPAYLRFVAKHGLFAEAYDVDVYFVPLFVGLNKTAYEPSMRKFRKTASPEIVDHVLFSKDELAPLQEALDMRGKDTPYFFLLDRSGHVVHRTEGAYSDAKLEVMEDFLMD